MPFDGFGNFLRLYSWVVDATNSVKIRADRHDAEDNNFTAGLSNCITRDGQSIISQNTPWNSRRITALADPVDPQDASTRAYADTKLSASGGGTVTGNVTVTGTLTTTDVLTVGGTVTAIGYQTRNGMGGAYTGHYFDIDWNGSTAELWMDGTDVGAIATQAYATAQAINYSNLKLSLTGGTLTGALTLPYAVATSNTYYFTSNTSGYIQWQGGGTYVLGGGGTIWHSGNFNPSASSLVSNARLAFAGDRFVSGEMGSPGPVPEAFAGAVMTGMGGYQLSYMARFRYLQLFTTAWFTVGYA